MIKQAAHLALGLVFLCTFAAAPALPQSNQDNAQQDTGNIDLVLVIDLSKSMRGVGGTADIFDRIKQTSKDIIRNLEQNDSVTLVAFSESVRTYPTVTLHGEAERQRLFEMISDLEAEGNWTHTAAALRGSLKEADRLQGIFSDHRQVVFILTDGLNDPPPGAPTEDLTLAEVAKPYAGNPWFVYQVQYGADVDENLRAAIEDNFPKGGTITDRNARGGIDSLRPVLETPAPPEPKSFAWNAEPNTLSLELNEPGASAQTALRFDLPGDVQTGTVRAELQRSAIPEAISLSHEVVSTSEGGTTLRLAAEATESIENSSHQGTVRLSLTDTSKYAVAPLEVPLEVQTAMVPPVWPWWVGGILGGLLLLGGAFFWYRRRQAQQLVGTLSYWPEDGSRSRERVRLGTLGREATIGSKDIPLGDEGEVAVLSTQKVDDRYHPVVRPQSGNRLRFDGQTTVELPLYNGDEFALEGWEFQYRGPVPRRPRTTGTRRRSRNV